MGPHPRASARPEGNEPRCVASDPLCEGSGERYLHFPHFLSLYLSLYVFIRSRFNWIC